jgi:hypothetical protein
MIRARQGGRRSSETTSGCSSVPERSSVLDFVLSSGFYHRPLLSQATDQDLAGAAARGAHSAASSCAVSNSAAGANNLTEDDWQAMKSEMREMESEMTLLREANKSLKENMDSWRTLALGLADGA